MCLLLSHTLAGTGLEYPKHKKTLLQILVEGLPKHGGWPEKAKTATQSVLDGEIYFRDRFDQLINRGIKLEKVVKFQSSRVTSDQYEAALAAKGIYPVKINFQFVDADGWIVWAGGECPVFSYQFVDVKFRSGETEHNNESGSYSWRHGAFANPGLDIIAYRLHQPQDATSRANDDRIGFHVNDGVKGHTTGTTGETDLNECIGQPQEDIKSIRAEMLECLDGTGLKVNLRTAMKLVDAFIGAGYRKQ